MRNPITSRCGITAVFFLFLISWNIIPAQVPVPEKPRANGRIDGVDTWDLVLISKHILGIQPLGSPYKMIAADANKTGAISKADVVELSKLILGVRDSTPFVPSVRHIPENFVFEYPQSPLLSFFPEKAEAYTPQYTKFLGIKIGDVSNPVVGSSRPAPPATETALAYGAQTAHTGAEIEVPVFANQDMEQSAWQMALHYDPARMQLLDVRWPSTLNAFQDRNWHEPAPGEIRLLWYDGEGKGRAVSSGTPLFYLKFKSLGELADPALTLDDGIPALSYSAAGDASALKLRGAALALCRREEPATAAAPVSWRAEVYPNPAGDHFRVDVSVPEAGDCHIVIFDLFGRSCWEYKTGLNAGLNSLEQTPRLPAGQYLLQCDTDLGRKTVRFEKY